MPLTLHQAVLPNWLQQLSAVARLTDLAAEWCQQQGESEEALLGSRIADDMLPLAYQFKSCWTHSRLALEGARGGSFSPHMDPPPATLAGCRDLIREAIGACEAADPDELERLAPNTLVFSIGDRLRLDFTVQDFLLGFSTPNLYFHAATAYDILRMRGLTIGKRDFLGALRTKS